MIALSSKHVFFLFPLETNNFFYAVYGLYLKLAPSIMLVPKKFKFSEISSSMDSLLFLGRVWVLTAARDGFST